MHLACNESEGSVVAREWSHMAPSKRVDNVTGRTVEVSIVTVMWESEYKDHTEIRPYGSSLPPWKDGGAA